MYIACIKNISTGEWLWDEHGERPTYTEEYKERLLFFNPEEAESTLDMLEASCEDCHTLIVEPFPFDEE